MRQIGTMLIKERNNADSGLPSPLHPLDVMNKLGTVQKSNGDKWQRDTSSFKWINPGSRSIALNSLLSFHHSHLTS